MFDPAALAGLGATPIPGDDPSGQDIRLRARVPGTPIRSAIFTLCLKERGN